MAYRTIGFESGITDADSSDGVVEVDGLRFTVTAQGSWTLTFNNGRLNFAEDPAFASSQFKIEITNITGGALAYNDFIINYQSNPLVVDGWAPSLNFSGLSISDSDLSGNYTYNGEFSYKHQIPGFPMPGSGVVTKLVITDNPAYGSTQNPYSSFWLDQLVVDTDYAPPVAAPAVVSVSSADTNKSYKAGDLIHVTVTFDQAVDISTAGGTPTLRLETGSIDRTAVYTGGSGTATLTFQYTVQAGDTSVDLDYIGATALQLNGATIKLSGETVNAVLTLPTPGAAGSLGANNAIVIDTTAPSAPLVPVLAAASDSGHSNSDGYTNNATPTFGGAAGSVEAGATIRLYDTDGTTVIGTTTANGDGSWSVVTSTVAEGTHTITAKATDATGNVSTASSGLTVTIDLTPPTTQAATAAFSADTGASASDLATSVAAQTISGTLTSSLAAEARVEVSLDNGGTWNVATASNGSNTWTIATTLAGSHTLQVRVVNAAGNFGPVYSRAYTLDTAAPAAPSTPDLDVSSDIGSSSSDDVTGDTTPTFSGTAENGAMVTLYEGTTEIGSAVAVGGVWSITSSLLAQGTHSITARAVDTAGNTSLASSALTVVVDGAAPTLVQTSPSTGATNVSMLADLALTFSEAVRAGLGTIELHSSDGALIETFDVSSSSRIHISGNVVTIDPTLPLGSGSGYYLTVSAGAFTDASGNDFAGIIDASTIKFTTSGISAPTVRQNEHGGQNIVVTDPSQITADLGTDSVDHLFYSGSGTITLPSSIENLSLTGGSTKVEANGLDNTLRASVGNDTVNGGAGRDTISGGAGHDQLSGSSGNDRISGGTGSDVVDGGSGNDRIFGDTGNDTIWGGVGSDRVSGGSGRDSIYGGMGNDQLSGGAGDDRLFGGSGNDSVHGGSGNDRVYGDSGHDTVHGSFGNDTIYGGTGNDVLSGGSRRDSFVFDTKLNAGSNVDTIRDFTSGEDSVWLDRAIFAELGVGYEEGRMSLGASSFVYGTSAQGAQDRIIYDWFTGSLYYDCDGTGLAAQVKFATVSNNALLTYRDFFVV